MPKRFERLDHALGRLVYRAFGSLFAVAALICLHSAYRHATDWYAGSFGPAVLFGAIGAGAALAASYCFARKRTLTEALDAVEGGAGKMRDGRTNP